MIVARFTCEILGAIPVGDLDVQARLVRPGRSVEFLEAVASRAAGRGPGQRLAGAAHHQRKRPPSDPPPALPDHDNGLPPRAG